MRSATLAAISEAVPFFRRAMELDPEFALAHARLGTVYSNIGQGAQAVEHRTRAYELRDRVSERERLYITAHYYNGVARDNNKALETYDIWKQAYPRDAVPYVNSGRLYAARGETDKALESLPESAGPGADTPARLHERDRHLSRGGPPRRCADARRASDQGARRDRRRRNQRLYDIAARKGDRASTDRLAAILENSSAASTFLGTRAAEMAYLRPPARVTSAHRAAGETTRAGWIERARSGFVLSAQANTSAFLGETALARSQAEAVTQTSLDIPPISRFVSRRSVTKPNAADTFVRSRPARFPTRFATRSSRPSKR